MKRKWLATPYLVWMTIFIMIPLLMIFYYAFMKESSEGVVFTLEFIKKSFDQLYLKAFYKSFQYASISTIYCLILAYPLALILSRKARRGVSILFVFILPMWMNFLLRTYAWLSLLETNNGVLNTILRWIGLPTINIIGTPNAIILGMVYNFLPFMILPIYNSLTKIDNSILEAASDLGANNYKSLIRIVIPMSMPGVFSGITMVFMPAVTSFVIPNLLGSGKVNLIGNLIEQQFLATYNWGFGSSLSLILMLFILASIGIMNRMDTDVESGAGIW